MKYKAMIFDLFGTLIRLWPPEENQRNLFQMAYALSAPPYEFVKLWMATFGERMTGEFADGQANIRYICERLGIVPDDHQVEIAAKHRHDGVKRELLTPKPGARETLSGLKMAGLKTGLLSNCDSITVNVWNDTIFASLIDVPVFSYVERLMKPNPRIFQIVVERLGVEPVSCIYVADGMDEELDVAADMGMHSVMIRDPYEKENEYQMDISMWNGTVISSLIEVLELIKEP